MEVDTSPKEKPSSKKTKKQKSNKGVSCLRHFKAYASLTGPVNVAAVLPAVLLYQGVKEHGLTSVWPCFVLPIFNGGMTMEAVLADKTLAGGLLFGSASLLVFAWALTLLRGAIQLFHDAGGTLASNDPPTALVVSGAYAHMRHPMSFSTIVLLLCEGVILGMPHMFGIAFAYALGVVIYQHCWEEPELRERYGESYEEYEANVGGWCPRCSAYDPSHIQI